MGKAESVEYTPLDVTQKAQAEIELLQNVSAMQEREMESISANVTDLLRARNEQKEELDALKSKLANLEEVVADLIARNCLLMKPVPADIAEPWNPVV